MKIDTNNNLTISGGSISSSKYGISEENAPFVIKMMIDNLYSNKPLAIIREYITNAWDAHVDAGISDTPIQIFVPTAFKPTLSIRDFGKGLSRQDVLHFYTQMADSRKRHTDDFVGGFGIGCKCSILQCGFISQWNKDGVQCFFIWGCSRNESVPRRKHY